MLQRLDDQARVAVNLAANGQDWDLAVCDAEGGCEERAGEHRWDRNVCFWMSVLARHVGEESEINKTTEHN